MKLQFKAKGFTFLPRQPIHSVLAGRHASRLRGRGLNFEEIRRYLPGDDIRNMDSRVTARVQKPHVRVYTQERDQARLLVVDQCSGMFSGTRHSMKSVTAAQAAALAAWRAFHAGDRVGLIFLGNAPFVQAPFTDDLEVCRQLLDEAQVRMAGPRTMLGNAIGKAVQVFEERPLDKKVLILLTDGNDTGSLVPPVKADARCGRKLRAEQQPNISPWKQRAE